MNHLHTLFTVICLAATNAKAESPTFQPPDQSSIQGEHHISIKRTFASDDLGKFIAAAESLMPERAEVLGKLTPRGKEAMERLQPKDLWWYESVDETLIPYALTGGCLTHLTERSKAFVKSVAEGKRMLGSGSSRLIYTATAVHQEQFELEGQKFRNVTVVTLSLKWSQRAMWFSKERVVVFDDKGNPVKVFHDGTTGVGMT